MGVGRHLARVAALAADRVDLLGQHGAGFVLDQARRQLDRGVGGDQLLAHFAAQAVHQRALELALQVGADVGAELRQLTVLHAEALDEGRIDLRHHRLGHLGGLDRDLDVLAGQRRNAPVGRERDVQGLFLALGQADQALLDLLEHHALADDDGALLGAFGRQAFVTGLRPGFQRHQVAFLRATRDRLPGAALLAQVLDHLVDVGVGDFGAVAHHGQLGHVHIAEVRHQLDGGDEIELALAGLVDARGAGNAQLMLAQRGVEGLAQQAVHRFGAHLLAKTLLDHLGRHLARTEALDAHGARDLAEPATDVALQALLRQGEGQAAFQVAGGFDRSLHVDSCHRWRPGPRYDVEDERFPTDMIPPQPCSFADSGWRFQPAPGQARPGNIRPTHGWCERGDSNPHALRHWNLNPGRLPIPPLSRPAGIVADLRAKRTPEARLPRHAIAPMPPASAASASRGHRRAPAMPATRQRKGHPPERVPLSGGLSRIRTLDLLIKSQLLYQLS